MAFPCNRPDGMTTSLGETIPTRTEAQITGDKKADIVQCVGCRRFMVVQRFHRGRLKCKKCRTGALLFTYNISQEE